MPGDQRSRYVFFVLLFLSVTLAQQSSPSPASPETDTEAIRAEIRRVEESLPKIPDRGAALFLEAKLYVRLGQMPKALALVKECVSLNEGFDPGESPALRPLWSYSEFRKLARQVRRRYPPVHKAVITYTIAEKDLFPEGLACDSGKHVFYMGSMHHRKIIKITSSGEVSDFVKPGMYNLLEIGGIKVDPADHSVWAASDHEGASELVHFDGQGNLVERFPATDLGRHIYNDLVLRGPNEVYVTDTSAHQVYRFDRKLHTFAPLTFHRLLFYPNGIALSDDGNLLYVADLMGVIRFDLRSQISEDVNPGKGITLAGLDGMYWYHGSLLGIQYGTGSYRVVRWPLSPDGRRVASAEILEHRTPLLSFPTTEAITDDNFYYIANTGIGNLEHDKIIDPAKLEPIHIAVISLK